MKFCDFVSHYYIFTIEMERFLSTNKREAQFSLQNQQFTKKCIACKMCVEWNKIKELIGDRTTRKQVKRHLNKQKLTQPCLRLVNFEQYVL